MPWQSLGFFIAVGNLAKQLQNTVTIPDLERANALLIGGNWTVIREAYVAEIKGWLTLETSQYSRINVRESAVEGVRYNSYPAAEAVAINTPWAE